MYTKKIDKYNLFRPEVTVTTFYKDGKRIAERENDGAIQFCKYVDNSIRLTRAWAFRHWEKHFKDLPCWLLPDLMDFLTDSHVAYLWLDPDRQVFTLWNECDEPCGTYHLIDGEWK